MLLNKALHRIELYGNKFANKTIGTAKRIMVGAPSSCIFDKSVKVYNSTFGGKNCLNYNVEVINSDIGYGTYIGQNSRLLNCKIGKYCEVGLESMIGAHPIHKWVSMHPAFFSTTGQYGFTYVDKTTFEEIHYVDDEEKYFINIGNDVWVTAGNTKIIQGITIGDGALVMLDAVVTKDVPPYAIVGGVPAKIIGYRFEQDDIDFLLKLRWWDKGEEWINAHIEYFDDIKRLRSKVEEENQVHSSTTDSIEKMK